MNNIKNEGTEKPWIRNYDPHIPARISYPSQSINKFFETAVKKYSDLRFLIHRNINYTYKEIFSLVDKIAKILIYYGLEKGERVALILPNIPQFVIAYYGILRAGGIVVAMNPGYKLPEYEFIFNDSQPAFIICQGQQLQLIREIIIHIPIKLIITTNFEQALDLVESRIILRDIGEKIIDFQKILKISNLPQKNLPVIDQDDAAVFQYSGGTTGSPKAAVGTHKNIVSNMVQFAHWCDLKEIQEVILAAIPLYHVYGMVLAMNLALQVGAAVVLNENPRDIDRILLEIEKNQVSFYPGVPTMYYAINQNERVRNHQVDLSSIRACISGSAPLHPQIKKDFETFTGGKLVEGYGLSEAPTATHCNPVYGINKTGSIGLPLPDVDCKVVDLETGESEMPVNVIGELIIKAPQVMRGYFNQPKESKATIRNGWLYTGDVVRMDEDGYFYIIDRKKSLIKVGGFQVWPNEIEAVINSNEAIIECAVGGVPDLSQGEKVIAWVVKREGSTINEKDLIKWCENSLSGYKIPSEIHFIEKVPRSSVGKILRRELIAEYLKTI